jgi:hypothetical protein
VKERETVSRGYVLSPLSCSGYNAAQPAVPCTAGKLHTDSGVDGRRGGTYLLPSRGGVYPAGPGSDATRRGGRDETRSDGRRKGRNDGTGYAARDIARPARWADPALRRERERERDSEKERESARRAHKKERERQQESERERERARTRKREKASARGREREREKESTRARGRRASEKGEREKE